MIAKTFPAWACAAGLLVASGAQAWTPGGVTLLQQANLTGLQIASDGSGGGLALFVSGYGPYELKLLRFTSGGAAAPNWPVTGVLLDPASNLGQSLVPDGSGGAFVSWRRDVFGRHLVAVQHALGDGTRAAGWPDTGVVVVDGPLPPVGPARPAIAADGTGGVFVAWEDYRDAASGQIVYAHHIGANAAVVTGWPGYGRPCAPATGGQYDPALVDDGSGGVIVTWRDGRNKNTTGFDIRAQRFLANGTWPAGWPLVVCDAARDQTDPAICSDGAGGAIITWADERAGLNLTAAYAQHLHADGSIAPGWVDNGVLLGNGAFLSVPPAIVADDASGAFIAWRGAYGLNDEGATRITHVLDGGAVATGWPAGGRILAGPSASPSLTRDGSGGVVAVLDKASEFKGEVLRIRSDGTSPPGWSTPIVVEWPNGTFAEPVVGDGTGGALLGWIQYGASPESRIRLQRVSGDALVAPEWDGSPRLSVGGAMPNPVTGPATLRFALPGAGPVSLALFDPSGRRVRTIVDGTVLSAGQHALRWDTRDDDGRALPAGLYFLRLDAGAVSASGRLVVTR